MKLDFFVVNAAEVDIDRPIGWKEASLYALFDAIFWSIKWGLLCLIIWVMLNSLSIGWIETMGQQICPLLK